jgi:medium-chain acyl-[acyl-carrier-protein] hydrolase
VITRWNSAGIDRDRPWLVPEPDRSLPLRLFCFPHAGAGVAAYRSWREPLASAGVAVCPVQLPGRENRFREAPYRRLEPLVDALVPALAPHLYAPFALFGHSMGALVAFEVTRALRSRGLPTPFELHVSGRIAPQLTDPRGRLHDLPDAELVARLRALGGVPPAVLDDADLMRLGLRVLRADLAVNETYRYVREAPLDVTITAWAGAADPKVDEHEVRAWAQETRTAFRARTLAGGHFFIVTARSVLLRQLVADLQTSKARLAA